MLFSKSITPENGEDASRRFAALFSEHASLSFRASRIVIVGLLLVLFLGSEADPAKGSPAANGPDSALTLYRTNLSKLLADPRISSARDGKTQTSWVLQSPESWKDVRSRDLPPPLDRRAIFLKAWFRSSGLPLTRKGLVPALRAFPDLAPVLLWHLAHSEGISMRRRTLLSRLSAGSENRIFNPSSRPSRSGERARALWKEYLDDTGGGRSGSLQNPEDTVILRRLVSAHPLSPESSLALLALGERRVDGAVLVPRWVYLQKMGSNDLVLRETRNYLSTAPPFPFGDRALYLEIRSLAILGHSRKALSEIEGALGSGLTSVLSGKQGKRGPHIYSELEALRCRILLSESLERGAGCIDRLKAIYPDASFLLPLTVSALRQDLAHPLPAVDPAWIVSRTLWTSSEARDAVWLLGLDYAMRGDASSALSTWKALSSWLSSHPDVSPDLTARLLYFMGREEDRTGHPSRARALYAQVISHPAGTPYALWATISCRGECGSFRLRAHRPTSNRPLPVSLRGSMKDLIQMGLFGPALVLERFYRNPEMDREQIERYGDLNIGVFPRYRLRLVEKSFFGRGAQMRLPTGEWLSGSVLSGFRQSGVPTLWALAIARQESRFRERSLSVDGALGIMQLMPGTAFAVASSQNPSLRMALRKNLGTVRFPAVNSLIGGLYLKRLIDSVPGQPERAIAGYNAGLHAVMSWKSLSHADWDFFTESIPYQETRRYVREVLWNYAYLENRLKGKKL